MSAPLLPPHVLAALLDVAARFIANTPDGDVIQVDRLFFQLQQAHWFFVDFYVDNPALGIPHLSWEPFTLAMFEHCPLLHGYISRHKDFMSEFKQYMKQVPSCGMVLLNADLTQVVLVRSFRGKTWTFPRGKVNEKESNLNCAIREAYEETGFDCRGHVDVSGQFTYEDGKRSVYMFVAKGVPMDYPFAPRTRKEISKVAWFDVASLRDAGHTWGVGPVYRQLKSWIDGKRHVAVRPPAGRGKPAQGPPVPVPAALGLGGGDARSGGPPVSVSVPSGGRKKVVFSEEEIATAGEVALAALQCFKPTRVPVVLPTKAGPPPAAAPLPAPAPPPPSHHTKAPGPAKDKAPGPRKDKAPGPAKDKIAPGPVGKQAEVNAVTFGGEGGSGSWSVEEMFKANERLTGRKFTYTGSSHDFGSVAPTEVRKSTRKRNHFEGFSFDVDAIADALDSVLSITGAA